MGKFAVSETVKAIQSGRVRDDSYDEDVKAAFEKKGTVFEATYPNNEIDEVRKGLARSALYLKVRLATDFEEIEKDTVVPAKTDKNGNETAPESVKYGKTVVRFSAHDKMARNGSRKVETVETATAPAGNVETADA